MLCSKLNRFCHASLFIAIGCSLWFLGLTEPAFAQNRALSEGFVTGAPGGSQRLHSECTIATQGVAAARCRQLGTYRRDAFSHRGRVPLSGFTVQTNQQSQAQTLVGPIQTIGQGQFATARAYAVPQQAEILSLCDGRSFGQGSFCHTQSSISPYGAQAELILYHVYPGITYQIPVMYPYPY